MKHAAFFVAAVLTVLAIVASNAAGRSALPPVDQKQACLSCHSDLEQTLAKPNLHRPLSEGKCSTCHNPHASKHAGLLDDQVSKLCNRCHEDALRWLTRSNVHDPVSAGRCTVCHDAHGSSESSLLKNKPRDLCANCHADVKTWFTRSNVHDPVKRGQCDACHDPHAGDNEALMKARQVEICLKCHAITPMFTATHRGFDPQNVRCSACHDPHSSDAPSLVMKEVHPPFADRDCDACHAKNPEKGAGYPLKSSALAVCGECHSEEAAVVRQYSAHGASDKQSCEICHNGHASHDRSLLLLPERQLCRKCHEEKAAGTSMTDPHRKLACATCHAPHGSSGESYLVEADLTLCAKCHSSQHHVAHPMGETAIDKITKKPVTCVSCHQLHGWKADPLLPAEGTRDLCVRCHNK